MTFDRHPRDADSSRPSGFPELPPTDEELGPSPVHTQPERPVLGPPAPTPQQQAEQQFGTELLGRLGQRTPGWTDENYMMLEQGIITAFPGIGDKLKDEVMQSVMLASDPSIVDELQEKFIRQVGMSTADIFVDSGVKQMLGVVDDDEAFSRAAIDLILETGGAAVTAAMVFEQADRQKMTFDRHFLEDTEVRDAVLRQAAISGLEVDAVFLSFGGELRGLRGKKLEWTRVGDRLAMRWFDEAEDKDPVDVLIYLEPGTSTLFHVDVVAEYLLADAGIRHIMAPSSGDVPGRQNIVGVFFEGMDDIQNSIEHFGGGFVVEAAKDVSTAISGNQVVVNPSSTQQSKDEEALREQATMDAVKRDLETNAITHIMRQHLINDPGATMSQAVQAGIAGFAAIPDEVKEAVAVESVNDLEAAVAERRDRQSFLGEWLEQDFAPTALDMLSVWESAIHFGGIVLLDLVADPAGAAALAREVIDEGFPKAMSAYIESVNDIGTVAEYYGIDPDSGAATWVNTAWSIGGDPITWATLGGAASWTALRKGITTVAGAERILRSRPMLSMARNIVVNDTVRVIPLMSEGGMSSGAIARLARIAVTKYDTKVLKVKAMEEVLDIVKRELPAHGGFYIPAGPARVLRRKTTTGLARLAHIAPKDKKASSFLQDILVRAGNRRYVQVNERNWLDDMFRQFEVRRLNDPDGFADDIIRATEQFEAYRSGDQAVALLSGRTQVLKKELQDLAHLGEDIGRVPALRKEVVKWNDEAAALKRAADGATDDAAREGFDAARTQALSQRDDAQRLLAVDDLATRYNTRATEIAKKRSELKRTTNQIDELSTGSRDRSLLETHTHEYLDEWADDWGVPFLLDVDGNRIPHQFVDDLFQRDWSVVTGERGVGALADKAPPLAPLGKYAAPLEAIGMNPVAGITRMPVSAYDMLIWHTMQRNKTSRFLFRTFRKFPQFKKTGDGLQAIWSAQVLFNSRTAVRSHLDEVIRFYEDAGMSTDLLKAGTLAGKVGPEAAAFTRNELDSFLPAAAQEWKIVSPSTRGMIPHAERWINGTLMKDRLFRAYARAVVGGGDDITKRRALWQEYWDTEGAKLAKTKTIDGVEITGGNSFDIMDGSFKWWVSGIKEGRLDGSKIFDDMIQAAANNRDVVWPKAVWRQLPDVPAQVSTKAQGFHPIDAGFRFGYGLPQNRRGSVFYDHAYNWSYDMYKGAFKGRIIDEDWLLAKGYADDLLHAQELMDQGYRSQVVRDLINETGMVLDTDMRNAAMRWAGASADDMMYTFGATSIFGKKVARIYPFGRAQVDYLQWWWKKLTQPTQFTGGQIPVVGGVGRAAGRIPIAGANLRLVDRMAHLVNLADPDDERPGTLTPAGFVNNFTFLPYALDEQVLIDTTPSFGPVAGWMLNLPFVPDDVRNVVQELHPAHRIFSDPFDSTGSYLGGLWDAIVPKGGLSIWNLGKTGYEAVLLAGAYATFGYDPALPLNDDQQRRITSFLNARIREASGGPWRNDFIKLNQAQWIEENAFDAVPDRDPDSDIQREWALLNDRASIESLTESVTGFVAKMAGVPSYGGSDFSYVETLYPVEGFVDAWFESGSISDAKRDAIMLGLRVATGDDSTPKDRLGFADEVLDTLFTLLTDAEFTEFVAKNPGVTANLVSFSKILTELVPTDAADGIVGDRIKTADIQRARDLRAQGNREGWLIDRDASDVRYDMLVSAHRAFREYLDVLYTEATGLPISSRKTADGKSTAKQEFRLTPQWWTENKEWLGKVGFNLDPDIVADLTAGIKVWIPYENFKATIRQAKDRYTYEIEVSNEVKAKLERVGIDDRDPTSLTVRLSSVEGFDRADFDATVGLSYYGSDLIDDFDAALADGQKYGGWSDLSEWDVGVLEVTTLDDDDNEVVAVHDLDELRSRFRVAIALSALQTNARGANYAKFTVKDYQNSAYGRSLGELDWEEPRPPKLEDTKAWYETDQPELLHIVDGDTIEIQGPDGPVVVRLLGINTPEQGQPGYREAWEGLYKIINQADRVQFAIWEPNRYGLKMTTFTEVENVVVHRDRLFVWLYIDGVPLYDVNEFSQSNIRGVRTGGTVPDFEALLAAERKRGAVTHVGAR